MNDQYDLVIETFSDIWPRYKEVGYEGLTEAEQVIFCTWQFVCEVNNGGFHQYFVNPSGELAAETINALEKTKMVTAALLLHRAISTFPEGRPAKEHDLRCEQLNMLPENIQIEMFDKLTGAFYDSLEDPYQLQADYIVQNRMNFTSLMGTVQPDQC